MSSRTEVPGGMGHYDVGGTAEKQRQMNTLSYSEDKIAFGIEGYRIPKHGLPPRKPEYSVPKDKLSNFLEQTQRRGKLLPAPT